MACRAGNRPTTGEAAGKDGLASKIEAQLDAVGAGFGCIAHREADQPHLPAVEVHSASSSSEMRTSCSSLSMAVSRVSSGVICRKLSYLRLQDHRFAAEFMALEPHPHLLAPSGLTAAVGPSSRSSAKVVSAPSDFGPGWGHLPVVDPPRIAVVGVARLRTGAQALTPPIPGRSAPVRIPRRCIRSAVTAPMPKKRSTGSVATKASISPGGDGEQSVGFAVVRSDLRQHLVHRNPGRGP